jgi:phosphatidylserine/phosphatidylglycerophosphate/cardiolipin synthase-like enzyme
MMIVRWLLVVALTLGSSLAQTQPIYPRATPERTLEVIQSARREIWVLAAAIRNADVLRALQQRARSGVRLKLLIANQIGYSPAELQLAQINGVEARWIKERIGLTMLVADNRIAIVSPNLSGQPSTTPSIEIARPEVIAPMLGTVKQLFQTARPLR